MKPGKATRPAAKPVKRSAKTPATQAALPPPPAAAAQQVGGPAAGKKAKRSLTRLPDAPLKRLVRLGKPKARLPATTLDVFRDVLTPPSSRILTDTTSSEAAGLQL
ncbi:hypothetical protein DIPPA_02247 [Diplonema papillatum]|nr:hypothetical protein DIPPA_02247 [Diplonema papillatum]